MIKENSPLRKSLSLEEWGDPAKSLKENVADFVGRLEKKGCKVFVSEDGEKIRAVVKNG